MKKIKKNIVAPAFIFFGNMGRPSAIKNPGKSTKKIQGARP